ncbi:MAG: glycosyltransferase family A protein [Pseudomonadota bacterium]
MRVAVITPYHREPSSLLEQCHESVDQQALDAGDSCVHVLVADGHASEAVASFAAEHIVLPRENSDNGNTPRAMGSLYAAGQGFDAIAYLDADNWYQPSHIASLLEAHRKTGAPVCASGRIFHRPDGSRLPISEPEDGQNHCDTSCFLVTQAAYRLVAVWGLMPRVLSPLCDRFFFQAMRAWKYAFHYTGQPTLAFRTRYAAHYVAAGERPPDDAKVNPAAESIQAWHALTEREQEDYYKRLGFRFSLSGRRKG